MLFNSALRANFGSKILTRLINPCQRSSHVKPLTTTAPETRPVFYSQPSFYKYLKTFLADNRLEKNVPNELNFRHNQLLKELDEIHELVGENVADDEFAKLVNSELNSIINQLVQVQDNILHHSIVDDCDVNECTVEFRAGVGGKEASIFAEELFRLYQKFVLFNGWETRTDKDEFEQIKIDDSSSLWTSTIEVVGQSCYQFLRHEAGIHRVQRVPKTEKHGRIHTSTVSISVLPIRNNLVVVKDSDLRFEVKNSAGAGGQNVNRNLTCVRVTHVPTGHTVESQETRYQYLNKDIAIRKIKALLNQLEHDRLQREALQQKQLQVGIAARSDKIRTYNYPQNRITDHRLIGDNSMHNIVGYMNGEECQQMLVVMERLEQNRQQELTKQVRSAFEQSFGKITKTFVK